jgi:hypothetical protein
MQIEFGGKEPVSKEKQHRIVPNQHPDEMADRLHAIVRATGGPVTLYQVSSGFDEKMKQELRKNLETMHTDGLVKTNRHAQGDTYEPVMSALVYELPRPPLYRWMRSKSGIHPSFTDLPNHIIQFIGYEKRPNAGGDKRDEWWQFQVILGARAGETFWLPRICHSGMQVFSSAMFDPVYTFEVS